MRREEVLGKLMEGRRYQVLTKRVMWIRHEFQSVTQDSDSVTKFNYIRTWASNPIQPGREKTQMCVVRRIDYCYRNSRNTDEPDPTCVCRVYLHHATNQYLILQSKARYRNTDEPDPGSICCFKLPSASHV
jgi:hypothetical protein